jgi:hypothetical protein
MAAHRRLSVLMIAAISLGALTCSSDIFDVTVHLATQTYQLDFGNATGTVPTVTCRAGMLSTCELQQRATVTATMGPGNIVVEPGCDSTTSRCFVEATARVTYDVDVLQDSDFVTKVERHSAWTVKSVSLAYTLPTNTLTFDVPKIDVYVGPPGTTTENDPDVAFVDSTAPVPAGTTFTDPQQLTVAAGSPARDLIVSSVESKRTIVFVVVAKPRIEAGAPIPAGALELDVYPSLLLGF